MEAMFMLIGFSLCAALTFLVLFIWAVRSGQYEDRYTPSLRMLFDNPTKGASNSVFNDGTTDSENITN